MYVVTNNLSTNNLSTFMDKQKRMQGCKKIIEGSYIGMEGYSLHCLQLFAEANGNNIVALHFYTYLEQIFTPITNLNWRFAAPG